MDRKKNFLDMIGSLIPGYNGYAEREGRRNCDKILRDSISNNLTQIEKIISDRILSSISENNKELARQLDENKKRINTFSSRVKYAPHGESPLLSDNQIKEDELLQIYKTDLKLLESINAYRMNANNLTPFELKEQLNICLEIYDKRDIIINELK